jgi:hypothetical protein
MQKYFICIFIIFIFLTNGFCQKYADQVVFCLLGGINNFSTNIEAILYSPEYPQWNKDTILSLGGGYLVIDLGVIAIDGSGPDLKIYEAGESYGLDAEPFWVLGNTDNVATNWQYLGKYKGDICYVDFDSLNVDNIRYISIIDAVPKTDPGPHPGADFDAIEILNYNVSKIGQKDAMVLQSFELHQNYPNPFNPMTTITYNIAKTASVTLEICDSSGKKTKTLIDDIGQVAGRHEIVWDGTNDQGIRVSSGAYYCTLQVNQIKLCRRMILIK